MKKLLLLGTAAMLVSTSVFATQSRLLALGMDETDNEGMYYIEDSRNMFLNPAYVNLNPNLVVAEWGSSGFNVKFSGSADGVATISRVNAPKAQGGAFTKVGDLVFGVYMGNESNTSSLLRVAGTSAISTINGLAGTTASRMLPTADNQVDVFVGGDAGVKWGVNATYGSTKDEVRDAKQSAGAIRGGVIGSGWDAHLNLSVNNKAEATDTITVPSTTVPTPATVVKQEFEGKLGAQLGGSYVVSGNNRLFGYVKHYGWEQTDSFGSYPKTTNLGANSFPVGGQTGMVKGDFTSYYLGWGSHFDVNTTDRLFTSVSAKKTDINLKFNNKAEVRHIVIPLTIGYEAVATEWLTLRGSIVQNLWGSADNKNMTSANILARNLIGAIYEGDGKRTPANTTKVNAGATLTFGQLSVDGLIGLTNAARNGTVAEKNTGILALDNLASSVAMTYKF